MTTIKTFKFFKKSSELDDLYSDIYDKLVADNKHHKFKSIMKKISAAYVDNNYLPTNDYVNWGANLYKKSIKEKKPAYVVCYPKYGQYSFFIGALSSIKKILTEELSKINVNVQLKETVKIINSLDAALLAYLALVPKPFNGDTILPLLSKESLTLAKCLLNIKGKYSKKIKKQANIYREWVIYKNSCSPKRKNLNLHNIY